MVSLSVHTLMGLKISSPDAIIRAISHLDFHLVWFQQTFIQHPGGARHCARQSGQQHEYGRQTPQQMTIVPCVKRTAEACTK